MNNPLARHLDRLLAERDELGVTAAERIAVKLVECSLAGDANATGLILRVMDDYDPCLADVDEEDE